MPWVNAWRARGHGECVGADHPGAVCGDVAAADGGEPKDECWWPSRSRPASRTVHSNRRRGRRGRTGSSTGPSRRRPGRPRPAHGRRGGASWGAGGAARAGNWNAPTTANTAAATTCRTRGREGVDAGVGGQQLRTARDLEHPQRPGNERDGVRATSATGTRQLGPAGTPSRRAGAWTRRPSAVGWLIARVRREAPSATAACGVVAGARGAPQRVAEADHGDAVGEGEQPVEGVRQDGERDGEDAGDGQERGRPAGQDACPVQRDAEDEAAGQVGDPGTWITVCIRPMSPLAVPSVAAARTSLT